MATSGRILQDLERRVRQLEADQVKLRKGVTSSSGLAIGDGDPVLGVSALEATGTPPNNRNVAVLIAGNRAIILGEIK